MKIAVPYEDGKVFQHFGKSQSFCFYDTEGGNVTAKTITDTAGNGHSALVGFLKGKGAELLICGGIGAGARSALLEAGIQLIAGASGDADTTVASYLAGTLVGNDAATCDHHHEDGHSCGGHHEHTCAGHCK